MKIARFLILIIIVVLLLYFFFNNLNFEEIAKILSDVNPLYLLIFITGLYLQFFIRAYRWRIILSSSGVKPGVFSLYNYIVIGFFINTIMPGRIGEIARGVLVAGEDDITRSRGLSSIVMERLIDTLMIILIFFSSLIFLDQNNSPIFSDLKKGAMILLPAVLILFILFYLVNLKKMERFTEAVIRFVIWPVPSKYKEKVKSAVIGFLKGLKLNLSFTAYLKLLVSSVLVWLWLIPFYWILMKGFRFGNYVSLIETVPYFSIIVISAAVPTPGMTGSLDAASKYGLIELYRGKGITQNEAGAYTILVHFLILLVIAVPGIIALKMKGLKIKALLGINKKDEMS